jgi:hypothetical protein
LHGQGYIGIYRGRKKAALTYVVTYVLGCATKHWDVFGVLFVGRLFCGVATSLLYSAFESWLVAEHFKVQWPYLVSSACVVLASLQPSLQVQRRRTLLGCITS